MATSLSAGVIITETDLSPIVPQVATTVAAYVGSSTWGPCLQRTLVTDENEFVDLFGEPTDSNYEDFFTVAGFLKYGRSLYYVRAKGADTLNSAMVATITGETTLTGKYIDNWETNVPTFGAGQKFQFFAKYAGAKGNTDVKVGLLNYTDWSAFINNGATNTPASGYLDYVEYGPEDGHQYVVFVERLNSDNNWEITEKHLVSDVEGSFDNFGNNIYINEKINKSSKSIFAFNNTGVTQTNILSFAGVNLSGGSDGTNLVVADGWDLFTNPEEIEVNYLIGGSHTGVSITSTISEIAQVRADCFSLHDVAFSLIADPTKLSPSNSDTENIDAMVAYRGAMNTSYSALYGNWFYVYDKYNDKNRWVPSTGYIAGIYAHTADVSDAWFAPAGLNRGVVNGVIKIAMNPKKAYRDKLYQAQVNPIVNFPGQGIVVWGQKTLQTKASSFDRVNVRLLFLYMEKAIGKAAKYVVFEQNDSLTRAVFLNMTKPFMEDIKGRRGVTDFLIDVSDKVNTPEVIDNNEFRANIYVKATRSAEVIKLNFISTKSGVNFSELTA